MEKAIENTEEVLNTELVETAEAVEAEEEIIKPYTLRKINNGDLKPVLSILGKIGVKEFATPFFQVATKEKDLNEVGLDVALFMADILVKNMPKAMNEVDAWCADLAGISVDELNALEFGTTILIIYDVFGDVKNSSFFKVLSRLLV